jgi:hypothetical protein
VARTREGRANISLPSTAFPEAWNLKPEAF